MGIPHHLTCLLRNLYAGQEATIRIRQRTINWFQIGKGVHQGCRLSPCLFNLHAEYIMKNAGIIKKNTFESVLMRWMKLESIIQSEVSQKEKHQHSIPTTQRKTWHMDITSWSTPKSDWLYSLQPKMEKVYTVSKNKIRNWLWLRSWTPYCQIQTEIEESMENH